MFKMSLMHMSICFYCSGGLFDSYLHAVWLVIAVSKFWQKIFEDLLTCLGCPIWAFPSLCLLGDLTDVNVEIN